MELTYDGGGASPESLYRITWCVVRAVGWQQRRRRKLFVLKAEVAVLCRSAVCVSKPETVGGGKEGERVSAILLQRGRSSNSIIVRSVPMFTVMSSGRSHCENSPVIYSDQTNRLAGRESATHRDLLLLLSQKSSQSLNVPRMVGGWVDHNRCCKDAQPVQKPTQAYVSQWLSWRAQLPVVEFDPWLSRTAVTSRSPRPKRHRLLTQLNGFSLEWLAASYFSRSSAHKRLFSGDLVLQTDRVAYSSRNRVRIYRLGLGVCEIDYITWPVPLI